MKRLLPIWILILAVCFSFSCCKKAPEEKITAAEAKNAITNYRSDAIILECTYDSNANIYEIEFKTAYSAYIGYVNAYTGELKSVTVKTENSESDTHVFESETEEDIGFISLDEALAVAVSDSGASGTGTIIKRDLDRDNKTYNIIFRSGNTEYNYIIDAVTGDILSSETEIDS